MEYANGNELERDVQRFLRRLPEELLKNELNKLHEHCRAVIREGGAYVNTLQPDYVDFTHSQILAFYCVNDNQ